jgi:Type II CAAX prenyl endopeptidase Rce1-like
MNIKSIAAGRENGPKADKRTRPGISRSIGLSLAAKIVTVVVTTALFASIHYFDQGLAGAQQATITGFVFGTVFAVVGRIWMLMWAHAAFDLTALAIIYWNLESAVAHMIFKQTSEEPAHLSISIHQLADRCSSLCPNSRGTKSARL